MENEKLNQQSEIQSTPLNNMSDKNNMIHSQTQVHNEIQNMESSKVPFARFFSSKNRKKSLVFIFAPILLFVLGQSGPLWVAVMLMSPLLLAFILYGIVLFFKKDQNEKDIKVSSLDGTLQPNNKKGYKHGAVMLVIGLVLLFLAFLVVMNVRSSAGYSGSEGEIGAFPFMFSGAVFIILSIVSIAISFFTNLFRD